LVQYDARMKNETSINDEQLNRLFAEEVDLFTKSHPRAMQLAERAGASLVGRVPMSWMQRWASPVPPYAASAHGAEIIDVDGLTYLDFALGDTAAMAGHAPAAVVRAISEQDRPGFNHHAPLRGGH
jgi:glutamate-1-semialdehyde 2,1-aminomutase